MGIEGPRSFLSFSWTWATIILLRWQLGQEQVQFFQGVASVGVKIHQVSALLSWMV